MNFEVKLRLIGHCNLQHLTNPFIVTSSKQYGPKIKLAVNPHHAVTYGGCSGLFCMVWRLLERNTRLFCAFTAPFNWKSALSVHKICDGQYSLLPALPENPTKSRLAEWFWFFNCCAKCIFLTLWVFIKIMLTVAHGVSSARALER